MPMYADEIKGPCAEIEEQLEKAWAENEQLQSAVKETLDHCAERETYWNACAYDKRQSGKDDNYECGRASESAALADFLRGRFVALNQSSPSRTEQNMKEARSKHFQNMADANKEDTSDKGTNDE